MCKTDDYLPLGFPPADMPPLQRLIMLMLAREASDRQDVWATVDSVARMTGMVPRSARKHLIGLHGGGFVRVAEVNGRTIYRAQRETPRKELSTGQHNEK